MSEEKEDQVEIHLKTAKIVGGGKKEKHSMILVFDRVEISKEGVVDITPVSEEPQKVPHIDMFNALKRLVPHLVILTEFRPSTDFNKDYFKKALSMTDESLKDFRVTGVHWKEKGEAEFVTLVGRKTLSNGTVINLTPTVNISNHEDGYVFSRECADGVEDYRTEVELYTEGKREVNPQITAFPETEKERVENANPKPKGKAKKEDGKGGMKVAV